MPPPAGRAPDAAHGAAKSCPGTDRAAAPPRFIKTIDRVCCPPTLAAYCRRAMTLAVGSHPRRLHRRRRHRHRRRSQRHYHSPCVPLASALPMACAAPPPAGRARVQPPNEAALCCQEVGGSAARPRSTRKNKPASSQPMMAACSIRRCALKASALPTARAVPTPAGRAPDRAHGAAPSCPEVDCAAARPRSFKPAARVPTPSTWAV